MAWPTRTQRYKSLKTVSYSRLRAQNRDITTLRLMKPLPQERSSVPVLSSRSVTLVLSVIDFITWSTKKFLDCPTYWNWNCCAIRVKSEDLKKKHSYPISVIIGPLKPSRWLCNSRRIFTDSEKQIQLYSPQQKPWVQFYFKQYSLGSCIIKLSYVLNYS